MRVLITNNTLATRAGTELYVRDLAQRLQDLGHTPVAYSSELGGVAEELRKAGIPVIDELKNLPFQPDIIHGQHHLDTMTALLSLPGVPAIYVGHGAVPWEEMAPRFPRIRRYVAVDVPCYERMVVEDGIPEERVVTLLNFVDLRRFTMRETLPEKPKRALVFSNSASERNFVDVVRAACAQSGIELEVVGHRAGTATSEPEKILPGYDLVFAKARAALEAMAVGCAVVLCDTRGCGPLVTTKNFDTLRPLNFGFRNLRQPITTENVAKQIAQYDAVDAMAVRDKIRAQADLQDAAQQFVQLYTEVIAEHKAQLSDPAAESRAAGAYFESLIPLLKRTPKNGAASKHRLMEKLARKADRAARWLRA